MKGAPLIPFPLQIEIVSNNTAAKLTWRALKDRNAGFDPIISYSFVMGVYEETYSNFTYSELFTAEAPLFRNFTYTVNGLIPNKKYSFKYRATNGQGPSEYTNDNELAIGDYPQMANLPLIGIVGSYIIIDFGNAFKSNYTLDERDF